MEDHAKLRRAIGPVYRIRKRFTVEMAHILRSAFSKCCTACIHGHSYVIEVFLVSTVLNKDDMVIDFGELKAKIGGLINMFDHALVLPANIVPKQPGVRHRDITNSPKLIQTERNPTAEWMAEWIFEEAAKLVDTDTLKVEKIRVHETATGWAEYEVPVLFYSSTCVVADEAIDDDSPCQKRPWDSGRKTKKEIT